MLGVKVMCGIIECLLNTSSFGFIVVNMFYLTSDCDRFIWIIYCS